MKKVMAINAGSSSLKFKLFDMPEENVICSGIVERIGFEDAIFQIKYNGEKYQEITPVKDHAFAVKLLLDGLIKFNIIKSYDEIKATGHRIVQGGSYFNSSAIINEENKEKIKSLIPLSPLHNAAELVGIEAFQKILPNTPGICAFDTAFHQTMEPEDYIYPIPYEYTEKLNIRRYGAHGTSHKYLSINGQKYLDNPNGKIIICHLGSGASITAVKDQKCVATTMGLTPLDGLIMGTRCGSIDASVVFFLCERMGMTPDEVKEVFNKKSGMAAVSGVSSDFRPIVAGYNEGNERCKLALEMYAYRLAKFIASYYVPLGHVDAIVFSGGVGENGPTTRKIVCAELEESFGIKLDNDANYKAKVFMGVDHQTISAQDSKVKVFVIATNEELVIARSAMSFVKA